MNKKTIYIAGQMAGLPDNINIGYLYSLTYGFGVVVIPQRHTTEYLSTWFYCTIIILY